MPYKRKWKRRRRKKRSSEVVSLNNQPFPKSFITKHRYSVTDTLDPSVGSPDIKYYSCNGLYDPEVAVGGHQPLGFDQMTPMYDHYTVLGSRITVKAMSAAADLGTGGTIIGCYINDDASAVTSFDTVVEQGKAVYRILTGNSATGMTTFSKNFSTKKYFGATDVKDNDQLKGNIAANPSDGAYFTVFAQGIDASANPGVVYIHVLIEYIVQWSEQRSLSQS